MKAKKVLIFGGSGQIGRNLIRKLTKNNYIVTVVTRNIHQKSYIIKTQANAGYIDVVEANIFDENKIRSLFKKTDICINLIGILFEKKRGNTFKNIHSVLPSLLAKLCKEYNLKHFIHLSALGIEQAKDSLLEIEESLGLNKIPNRIECYDISNIQGTNPVGSMIVFIDGKPDKSHYRKFKIANVKGINDYEMMKEVLSRRLRNLNDINKTDWNDKPDLIIIDGGKGHLNASLQTLLELGQYPDINICSLAKKKEEIFIPEQSESIILPRNSKALHLFQYMRDEAHRFAITFHRSLRSKNSNLSILDSIPGIGPKKKYALLEKYQTIKQIENASITNIAKLYGFNDELAKNVKKAIEEWRKSQQEIVDKFKQR